MPARGCTQARTQLTQHTHARAHTFAYRLIFFIFNFQAIVETTSDKQNELTRNLKIHCPKYCSVKISIVKNCFSNKLKNKSVLSRDKNKFIYNSYLAVTCDILYLLKSFYHE